MFGLRIHSASAGTATVGPVGGTDGILPRSIHATPYTSSSQGAGVQLAGATSGTPAGNPRAMPYTTLSNSIMQMYRSSAAYEAAMVAAFFSGPASAPSGSAPSSAQSATGLPPWRGKTLLVLAVPTQQSPEEFFSFCGPNIMKASDICIIRNDACNDRYSVLLTFKDQMSADSFYKEMNGWTFSDKGEVCHVLFVAAIEFSTEVVSSVPIESIELPTCPICIERLSQSISGLVAIACDHSSQCKCCLMWANSTCSVCLFLKRPANSCSVCPNPSDSICLICGFVGCGKLDMQCKEDHSKRHKQETGHCYSLDVGTIKVDIGDLLRSKVENAIDEPTQCFVSAFESQRQYFKAVLSEAKGGSQRHTKEAIMKAVNDRLQELQAKINNAAAEKAEAETLNKKLEISQDAFRQSVAAIEQRGKAELEEKEKEIHSLGMDIAFYRDALQP